MAFGVVGYYDRESRDNPDYVMWEIKLHSVIDGVKTINFINYHKCTEKDYA